MLVLAMMLTTSAYAAGNEAVQSEPAGKLVEVLTIATGELVSYDENGVESVTFLTQEQVAERLANATSGDQITARSVNTTLYNVYVPKNINGNQGATVGSYFPVPHNKINIYVNDLRAISSINLSVTTPEGNTIYNNFTLKGRLISFPTGNTNLGHTVKVSSNDGPGQADLTIYSSF